MSDYMKEAERLMRQYTTAVLEKNSEAIAFYHSALLAHIQRGAVPDGWQDAAPKTQWAACPETGTPCSRCPTNQTQCHALAATAEVPMPVADEFQLRVFHPSRPLYTEETLRNYGDAREAAGYARGRAEAGRDAERYRWLRSSEHGVEFRDGDGVWRADCPRAEELDALIDAALRGEVKP